MNGLDDTCSLRLLNGTHRPLRKSSSASSGTQMRFGPMRYPGNSCRSMAVVTAWRPMPVTAINSLIPAISEHHLFGDGDSPDPLVRAVAVGQRAAGGAGAVGGELPLAHAVGAPQFA